MAKLPFILDTDEFYPLQPHESEVELSFRSNPQWAHMYRNIAEEKYKLIDESNQLPDATESPSSTVVTEYSEWLAQCKAIQDRVDQAREAWRQARDNMELTIARMKLECDELKLAYKEASQVRKPPQPQSNRKR